MSQKIRNNFAMDFQITDIHMVTLMIWEEYTAFGAGSSKSIRLLKFPFVADCKSICIVILKYLIIIVFLLIKFLR